VLLPIKVNNSEGSHPAIALVKKGKQMMKKVFVFVLALCFAVLTASAFAQDIQTKGSIGGTVTDPNGAVVPGATVTATGPEADRTTTTADNGIFKIDNLIPGNYSVKVTNQGFKTASVSNVQVLVGKEATLIIKLETGEVTAVV